MFKMAPTIVRNFFSKKATRRYPQDVRPAFAGMRGAIQNDMALCDLCGICAAKCPSRCITVDKKRAGWHHDPFACVYCGVCVEACKTGSLRQLEVPPRVAAAWTPVVPSRIGQPSE